MKTLIICEKPAAAVKIAGALSEKKRKKELNGVTYFEVERDGKTLIVVPAIGHLFTLKSKRPLKDYPVYDIEWVPSYVADRKAAKTKPFIETIRELAKDATEYISACDFDIEGSVIAYNILKNLCGEEAVKKAKRMKFSTLTAEELRQAYENLMPRLDFEMIDAGLTRHIVDWYWGMNVSRAMSAAVEAAGKRFIKLSAGRVQTPTLKILAEREKEIEAFKPTPYWLVRLILRIGSSDLEAEHSTERFWRKEEAEKIVTACKGKKAVVKKIEARTYQRMPPYPFDLGSLQAEAYRCFGYTPMRTQQLAQDLYLMGAISYPRTSSQKLPPSIGYETIIKRLGEISTQYREIANELLKMPTLAPREGPKSDPAHRVSTQPEKR
ncbi:MAG: DNA topoisomerase I [Candidatus Hadarchaeales archaeon]